MLSRADSMLAQDLDELLAKSPPYPLSTPQLGTPTLHDFVKGLILSTNIVDVIANHLPNGYRVAWGQVIDKDGNTLSRECDIIIYKDTPYKEIKNKSMKFVLVKKEQARIVIQVKSSIESVKEDDRKYCRALKKFTPKVWYIAECCWARNKNRVKKVGRELKDAGYEHFFYWYRRDDSLERTIDYEPFLKFVKLIKSIR